MPPVPANRARTATTARRTRPTRRPHHRHHHTPAIITVADAPTADSIAYIDRELAAVRGELARTDGKCGTLTAIATGAAAFIGTQLHTPLPARVLLVLALAAYVASTLLLLLALRPAIHHGGAWHRVLALPLGPSATPAATPPDPSQLAADDLRGLVTLAVCKFTWIRLATNLIGAGTLLLAAGLVTAAWS